MQLAKNLFWCFILLLSVHCNASEKPGTLIVRLANGEWPPYQSKNEQYYGIASRIVTEAFNAVGIKVEYGFFPWKRSFSYAKQGKDHSGNVWHGTLIWAFTTDRADHFYYSDTVISTEVVLFFLKKKRFEWETIDDLKGKVIGGTLYTSYPQIESAALSKTLILERSGDDEVLFKRLLRGRVDAIPQLKEVGNYYLENSLPRSEKNKITYSPTVLREENYHVIFSKNIDTNQEILALFNKGLAIIKSNGIYDRILNVR